MYPVISVIWKPLIMKEIHAPLMPVRYLLTPCGKKYIGICCSNEWCDAIAFTAGIGENTSFIREKIVSYLGYLGIKLDKKTNDVRGVEKLFPHRIQKSYRMCHSDQRGACNLS